MKDILRCHTTFLKNASPAVYEPVREENSDLMEELRMELESNLEFNQSEMEKESGPAKV